MTFFKNTLFSPRLKNAHLSLLFSTCLLSSGQAYSMEAIEFFEQLKAKAEANGNAISYGNLEDLGGGDVRASDIKVTNKKRNSELFIETLTVTGGETDGTERFAFDTLDANAIKLETKRSSRNTTLQIKTLNADNFSLDGASNGKYPFWPFDMSNGTLKNIRIVQTGKENISWNLPEIRIDQLNGGEGNAFSLNDFRINASTGSVANDDGANSSFALGEIRLRDLNVFEKVGFELGFIEMGRLSVEGSDGKSRTIDFNFDGLQGENIINPDFSRELNSMFSTKPTNATIGSASLSLDGQRLFAFGGGTSTGVFDPDTKEYQSDFSMNDMFFDLKAIGEANNQERELKAVFDLGYKTLNLDFSGDVSINFENGVLNIKTFKYSADDVAALDIALKLNGYTLDFASRMQKISSKMGEGEDPELLQALLFQMMAEMSALSIEEMQITLDDASLTKRILEQQAGKSGQKAEDMIAAIPFMAGAVLSQLDAPEFAAGVSTAIGTYLNSAMQNSGTLIISAVPDEPISFVEIMGIYSGVQAGNVKPSEVIDRLNLSVRAK